MRMRRVGGISFHETLSLSLNSHEMRKWRRREKRKEKGGK